MIIEKYLIESGSIKISTDNAFTWSSGIQSPVYCDNRLILSHTEVRNIVVCTLAERINNEFPDCQYVAGVATAGIPWAALISHEYQYPMCYVRSESKGHGLGKKVEGDLPKGSKVVVVEDTISTGGSILKAVESLREYGVEVIGCAAIFTYGFEKTVKKFEDENLKLITLANYGNLRKIDTNLPDFQI
jgi:orotate phosphoribosyltransferase